VGQKTGLAKCALIGHDTVGWGTKGASGL